MYKYLAIFFIFLNCFPLKAEDRTVEEGRAQIRLSTGEVLKVDRDKHFPLPLYFVDGKFPEGTRYQIDILKSDFQYIYVVGSDRKNNAGVIYSPEKPIEPESEYYPMILPSSRSFIAIDGKSDKDYVTILFSNIPLNPKDIVEKIISSPGDYYDKLKMALEGRYAKPADVRCIMNKIGFISLTDSKIVPITFEMEHR